MKQAVRAIITDEIGRVLLSKRGQGTAAGCYSLVGGKLDDRETPEEAVVREVREEVGLTFRPTFHHAEMSSSSDPDDLWRVSYFIGEASGDLKPDSAEIEGVVYISADELNAYDIAFNQKSALEAFFRSQRAYTE